jgi:GntR family transcriptional regulator / MocR family aminotransferase
MAKAEAFQDLALTTPPRGQDLWRWLYSEIRAAILDGRLKRGSRLPSERSLAKQYGLARGTVTAAFDQLRAEGYASSEIGSGTFVASGLPEDGMVARGARRGPDLPKLDLPKSRAGLSARGRMMVDGVGLLPPSQSIGKAFRSYEPAIDLFPMNLWARIAGRVLRRAPRTLYAQGNAAGFEPLRRAIAEYLGAARGVKCDAGQVVITSGAQQALDLTARLLLEPGDSAWVEDPCYPGARFTLHAAGANVVPIPVDQEGLNVAAARRSTETLKLIYVTPANQFPLGVTLSLDRRLALLRTAVNAGAWIVEDEYDAEYRYFGRPVAALHSLDRSGSVIYIGTFTKMLFNALRLGFVIVPSRLVDAFVAARSFIDRHPPTLDQAILAEFILEGHFGHHVRHMRQIYGERMNALKEAADRYLKGAVDVVRAASDMRTIAWIKTSSSDIEIAERARSLGIELTALSQFTIRYQQPPALILGFAACTPAELRRGVNVLASAMR